MKTLISCLITFLAVAESTIPTDLLIKEVPDVIAWKGSLQLEPITGHHINLKSPNSCGQGQLVSQEETKVECLMTSGGTQRLQIYVCDDKNTFCKREEIKIQVKMPSKLNEWPSYIKSFF